MRSNDLLTDLLKSVSRSLYLSLRVLPAPLRPVMGLGYLFCRAADTIADTEALSAPERLAALLEFRELFTYFPVRTDLLTPFTKRFSDGTTGATPSESRLLRRFGDAVRAFNELSRSDQALVQEVVIAVVRGMEVDLRYFGAEPQEPKPLATRADLENYLLWIGGEPGRFWTKACLAHTGVPVPDRGAWIEKGVRFGTGLQLINILRDAPVDLKHGRCYLPADLLAQYQVSVGELLAPAGNERVLTLYHAMIDDALSRLTAGKDYLEMIPSGNFRLRAAAWWPLAIGLETLGALRSSGSAFPEGVRIRRKKTYWILATSPLILSFDALLRMEFTDLSRAACSAAGFRHPGGSRGPGF